MCDRGWSPWTSLAMQRLVVSPTWVAEFNNHRCAFSKADLLLMGRAAIPEAGTDSAPSSPNGQHRTPST